MIGKVCEVKLMNSKLYQEYIVSCFQNSVDILESGLFEDNLNLEELESAFFGKWYCDNY